MTIERLARLQHPDATPAVEEEGDGACPEDEDGSEDDGVDDASCRPRRHCVDGVVGRVGCGTKAKTIMMSNH